MPSVIVVGAQWGDEGKGKIIDILSSQAMHIVHAQGGNNAGHTIVLGDATYKLHLIPTGILHPHTQCYIGAGTVIDPEVLIGEIEALQRGGIDIKNRLWISPAAHVIFPFHRQIDVLLEQRKGSRSIGTTGRGIGPCYADKANRLGIRLGEMIRPEIFPRVLQDVLALKNDELSKLFDADTVDYHTLLKQYTDFAYALEPFVTEVEEYIDEALHAKENVLFEGAQGTFLDLSMGTYPFVTSSHTIAGGVCVGAGVGPTRIDHTIGVIKAYTTRIGNGPLPTEVLDTDLFLDYQTAREYGHTVAGRKRRIGWFDAVMGRTAVRLNGLDSLAVTKLDVLDTLETIKICTSYEIRGSHCDHLPSVVNDLDSLTPVYETLPGWQCTTSHIDRYEDLPAAAKHYLQRIETLCQAPISMISIGPERSKTICIHNPFNAECFAT